MFVYATVLIAYISGILPVSAQTSHKTWVEYLNPSSNPSSRWSLMTLRCVKDRQSGSIH